MSGDQPCTSGELLARAMSGDAAAFGTLVRAHQRSVYSLALRMLTDRHQAEDLAQEVFLQLYRSLGSLESEEHLGFWLRRVTMHRAIDRLRREPKLTRSRVFPDSPKTRRLPKDPTCPIESTCRKFSR